MENLTNNILEEPLGKDIIKSLIPQREPILMLDQVTDYVPGEQIRTTKWLGTDAVAFQGHFPDFSILPGVLMIEGAAQTGAVFMELEAQDKDDEIKRMGVLGASKVRFRKPVFPNTQLYFAAQVVWYRANTLVMKVKVKNQDNQLVMSGEITLSSVIRSQLSPLTVASIQRV